MVLLTELFTTALAGLATGVELENPMELFLLEEVTLLIWFDVRLGVILVDGRVICGFV